MANLNTVSMTASKVGFWYGQSYSKHMASAMIFWLWEFFFCSQLNEKNVLYGQRLSITKKMGDPRVILASTTPNAIRGNPTRHPEKSHTPSRGIPHAIRGDPTRHPGGSHTPSFFTSTPHARGIFLKGRGGLETKPLMPSEWNVWRHQQIICDQERMS